jgi:hypothetical protein
LYKIKKGGDFMLPHFFEAEINSISYFTFLLPAAETLGLDSDKILEISVDYGLVPDGKQIVANAWAREQSGVIKGFIYTVHVPTGPDEQERILMELNGSEGFLSNLAQFVALLDSQE